MKQRKELPVYLFTGFLEAGKTHTLQETLSDPDFNGGEPMLLIVCEEGVEEYDPSEFAHDNVAMEVIEDVEDLTPEFLQIFNSRIPSSALIKGAGLDPEIKACDIWLKRWLCLFAACPDMRRASRLPQQNSFHAVHLASPTQEP